MVTVLFAPFDHQSIRSLSCASTANSGAHYIHSIHNSQLVNSVVCGLVVVTNSTFGTGFMTRDTDLSRPFLVKEI
jgi:hypothetical protein